MEAAAFGLIGVVIGALLAIAKEWWFQDRKNRKDAVYLAILVGCELDRFVNGCSEVVSDDGLSEGQRNEHGYRTIQIEDPKFEPLSLGVEWKALPPQLMYGVLDLPYQIEIARRAVSSAFEYAATPPDFEEGFEERHLRYATLGLCAAELMSRLRSYAGLASRTIGAWDPVHFMKERKISIESKRAQRQVRSTAQ